MQEPCAGALGPLAPEREPRPHPGRTQGPAPIPTGKEPHTSATRAPAEGARRSQTDRKTPATWSRQTGEGDTLAVPSTRASEGQGTMPTTAEQKTGEKQHLEEKTRALKQAREQGRSPRHLWHPGSSPPPGLAAPPSQRPPGPGRPRTGEGQMGPRPHLRPTRSPFGPASVITAPDLRGSEQHDPPRGQRPTRPDALPGTQGPLPHETC